MNIRYPIYEGVYRILTVRQQAVYGDAAAGREGLIAGCWRCRGINGCLEHY